MTSDISILAVLADRDRGPNDFPARRTLFQSSRSLRTATAPSLVSVTIFGISILAVLADRDSYDG